MADEIPFERVMDAEPGDVVALTPLIRRVISPNPGPFTFTGTATYIVGRGTVAIIDPGPEEPLHLTTLLEAIAGETVAAILVTHTHRDHSPLVGALKAATGAPVYAEGVHRAARSLPSGETSVLDASGDMAFTPDVMLRDGEVVSGPGWTLEGVFTPGHCANHMAFALKEENALFSGDHVMAWSTTVVAPPDGSMGDYMNSLEKLRRRDEAIFWPGHGGPVKDPPRFMRALAHHRLQREAAILRRLGEGDGTISAMVHQIYAGLDPRLMGAASLNVFSHLDDLVARGLVAVEGAASLNAHYRLAAS